MCGPNGEDLTPRSAKAQALLALLATSPDFLRQRTWLQDKLWSDRGRVQGAASLRQALSEIRRSLGGHSDVVIATRKTVQIDPERVTVHRDPETETSEFLEGLDVRDQEFEHWLTTMRQAPVKPAGPNARLPILLQTSAPILICVAPTSSEIDQISAEVMAADIGRSLYEFLGQQSCRSAPDVPLDEGQLSVRVKCLTYDGQTIVHFLCERGPDRTQFWSAARKINCKGAPPMGHDLVLKLVGEVTQAVGLEMAQSPGAAPSLASQMRRIKELVFSMDARKHDLADAMLRDQTLSQSEVLAQCWLTILGVIRLMERTSPDPDALRGELTEISADLLRKAPLNSLALAASAYVRLMALDQVAEAAMLAQRSTEINPANSYGWLARGFCALQNDEPKLAHGYMMRGWHLETLSPHRFFWDSVAGVSAVATGQLGLATQLFETSQSLSPGFRPPARYLLALKAGAGELEGAARQRQKLIALEPDFEVRRLIEDPSYPAAMIRKTGILKREALLAL